MTEPNRSGVLARRPSRTPEPTRTAVPNVRRADGPARRSVRPALVATVRPITVTVPERSARTWRPDLWPLRWVILGHLLVLAVVLSPVLFLSI